MDKQLIFTNLKKDFELAKKAKVIIDENISSWNDLYYGNKVIGDKKVLIKEVAKIIEFQKPNVTEPFLNSSSPARITRTYGNKSVQENYLNQTFTADFNREEFINDLTDIQFREGTCWTKTGWERKTVVEHIEDTMSMQDLVNSDINPDDIVELGNDMVAISYTREVQTVNRPTAKVIRNENIFPDPSARQPKEIQFIIEQNEMNYYQLKDLGICSDEVLGLVRGKIHNNSLSGIDRANESALAASRLADGQQYGYSGENSDNLNRTKFKLIEYWGYYDLKGNGDSVPIVSYWIQDFDMLITIEDNPLPSKEIPYRRVVYSNKPFSIWGNPVAFFIGQYQNVKNGIIKGHLDNLALSNNGQKFIQNGALDYINFQRLKKKERYIIVKKPGAIEDGNFNQLPGSIFNLYQQLNKESEDMAGISSSAKALTQDALGTSSLLSLPEMKMSSIVRSISALLNDIFKEWLSMAEVFLDENQANALYEDIPFEEQRVGLNGASKAKLTISVGTDASRIQQLQQYNMLMQQTKALGESVPKELINSLVASMFDLFDMYEEGEKLRNLPTEPTQQEQYAMLQQQQQEQQAMMLAMQEQQAKIEKLSSEAVKNQALAEKASTDSKVSIGLGMANSQKIAADTEGKQIDNILKPGQVMMDANERLTNEKTKG